MKNLLISSFLLIIFLSSCTKTPIDENLVASVNPLIGSDSKFELSNGNTYPAIAMPWGMNFWTPQTAPMGDGWCYKYSDNKIRGFKQTHQPSPWINDYGAFSIFATTDKLVFNEDQRQSWFSHKAETASPHYYKVYLADYNTSVEITPTDRAAIFRITYPKTDNAYLILDGFFKNSWLKVIPEERKIIGYARNSSGGVPENFKNYFVAIADKDFKEVFGVENDSIFKDKLEVESYHSGAIIRFKTSSGEKINLKVASSFISIEQAELNLSREIGNRSFDEIVEKGKSIWNEQLNRIKIEGATQKQGITFYSALYRTMLFPRKFYEFDKENKIVHYSPYNGEVCEGYMFTDNGFWDTFRAVFPFFNLMFRDLNSDIMDGLANTYKESGWLPEWASPGHRDCMIGSNSASIIADAYLKGIKMDEISILYEAILKNANNAGPVGSVGRYGVNYYNSLGYIPYDVGLGGGDAARTLEYAYDDFAIWKLSQALNRPSEEVDTFAKRALYYENVFDPSVNFMRGRNRDGKFQSPFRPDTWGDAFVEGCAWHWTWCVFHDVQGLINLMGGKERFIEKMDSVFTAPPTFDYSYYGIQIHEITEMAIADMGQYAHGNQPIQHMPYMYCYAGEPWKTQYHVRNIMNRLYTDAPDGLCGDEDNGQTSAWYVFSAMGMYPALPGSNQYVLGSPLFKKITLKFENGKSFTIKAANNSKESYYIANAKLNGKAYSKNYINHEDVMKGGVLDLKMSLSPEKSRGIKTDDFPYSMSGK